MGRKVNSNTTRSKVRYSAWKYRILPAFQASGWEHTEMDGKTYLVNHHYNIRFEYRYYGNCTAIWVGEIEVME